MCILRMHICACIKKSWITDIDECANGPCEHGNCIDRINSYTCDCDDGYEGDNCDNGIYVFCMVWFRLSKSKIYYVKVVHTYQQCIYYYFSWQNLSFSSKWNLVTFADINCAWICIKCTLSEQSNYTWK